MDVKPDLSPYRKVWIECVKDQAMMWMSETYKSLRDRETWPEDFQRNSTTSFV
jgi:hypothetical protein